MKKEGIVPDRDLILALTADEEGGESNGVEFLVAKHRNLIDAGYAASVTSWPAVRTWLFAVCSLPAWPSWALR